MKSYETSVGFPVWLTEHIGMLAQAVTQQQWPGNLHNFFVSCFSKTIWMLLLIQVKDPWGILVKTISWSWSYEEAHPIMNVAHKRIIAVKNFQAAETLFSKYFLFIHLEPIQFCNFPLQCLMISCGHESKLPFCVDVVIVITGLQPQLWCGDRWAAEVAFQTLVSAESQEVN